MTQNENTTLVAVVARWVGGMRQSESLDVVFKPSPDTKPRRCKIVGCNRCRYGDELVLWILHCPI